MSAKEQMLAQEVDKLRERVDALEQALQSLPVLENELVRLRRDRREMELYLLNKIKQLKEAANA